MREVGKFFTWQSLPLIGTAAPATWHLAAGQHTLGAGARPGNPFPNSPVLLKKRVGESFGMATSNSSKILFLNFLKGEKIIFLGRNFSDNKKTINC